MIIRYEITLYYRLSLSNPNAPVFNSQPLTSNSQLIFNSQRDKKSYFCRRFLGALSHPIVFVDFIGL